MAPTARLSLVEALFFVAHDEFTGKAVIGRSALEICLSGAIVCDLLFTGRITVNDHLVVSTGKRTRVDPASDAVIAEIDAHADNYPVREWLDHLRDQIVDIVVTQLAERGLVQRLVDRSLLRRVHRYPPVDLLVAAGGRSEIRSAVLGHAKPDVYNVSLALLAWSMGLDDLGQPELDRKSLRTKLDELARPLPETAAEVLAAVDTAVAAAVSSGDRR